MSRTAEEEAAVKEAFEELNKLFQGLQDFSQELLLWGPCSWDVPGIPGIVGGPNPREI